MKLHTIFLMTSMLAYNLVKSHVVLTFPRARPMAFDYMDNRNSNPPCGVQFDSDKSVMTTLVAGIDFTVTWHVAYPNQGGVKIQLIKLDGDLLTELTDANFVYQNDSTKLSHTVNIDSNITCDHCVLRILRQAKEWAAQDNGKSDDDYHFWSCADVTVVTETEEECFEGKCINGGTCTSGVCSCPSKFEGERCEYENECDTNSDCSAHGQCVDIGSTFHPKKVCFCEPGWAGRKCDKYSKLTNAKLKKSEEKKFRKIKLYENPEFSLFWRILKDKEEIEIAVRAKTDTWCAIGWRPSDVDEHCKKFPTSFLPKSDPDANNPDNSAEEEDNDEVYEEEEEKSEEEEQTENTDEEEKRRRRRRTNRRKRAVVDKQDNKINEIEKLCKMGNTTAAGEWARKSFDYSPMANDSGDDNNEKEDKDTDEDKADDDKTAPSPEPEPDAKPKEDGDDVLHAMDCMDIIFATAKGKLHRVLDSYTRDRSTPHHDAWYGGSEDLVAAVAKSENGMMYLRFIRKLVTKDKSDQPLLDQPMKMIWARGQTPTKFFHRPFSGLEKCEASDYGYYRVHELKYHGTKPSQRGSITYNAFDDPKNEEDTLEKGSFSHPKDCAGSDCDFRASWRYRKSTDLIHFSIEARVEAEEWAGIGFSEDKKMEQSDAVVGWIEPSSGKLTLTDRWLVTKTPEGVALDNSKSSLRNARGWYLDGKLKFSFSRARDTKDDNDLPLTECIYFLYAWGGSIEKGDIGKHTNTEVSVEKICIGSATSLNLSWSMAVISSLISLYLATSRY